MNPWMIGGGWMKAANFDIFLINDLGRVLILEHKTLWDFQYPKTKTHLYNLWIQKQDSTFFLFFRGFLTYNIYIYISIMMDRGWGGRGSSNKQTITNYISYFLFLFSFSITIHKWNQPEELLQNNYISTQTYSSSCPTVHIRFYWEVEFDLGKEEEELINSMQSSMASALWESSGATQVFALSEEEEVTLGEALLLLGDIILRTPTIFPPRFFKYFNGDKSLFRGILNLQLVVDFILTASSSSSSSAAFCFLDFCFWIIVELDDDLTHDRPLHLVADID